jgi:hypothetical protein
MPGGPNILTEMRIDAKGKLPTDRICVLFTWGICGENKNKTMFSFLADLDCQGIFSKFEADYLMAGHTYKDICQFFSVIPTFSLNTFSDLKFQIFLSACSIFDYALFYELYIDPEILYHQ